MGQLHTLLNITTVSMAFNSVNRHLEAETAWEIVVGGPVSGFRVLTWTVLLRNCIAHLLMAPVGRHCTDCADVSYLTCVGADWSSSRIQTYVLDVGHQGYPICRPSLTARQCKTRLGHLIQPITIARSKIIGELQRVSRRYGDWMGDSATRAEC